MAVEATVRVRYAETDQMGVVYYANYLVWFEIGRTEFFRSLALDYRGFESAGIVAPAIEARCRYHHSAHYDDELLISTSLTALTAARCEFSYRVVRVADGRVLADGTTKHAFVDNLRGRPVALRKLMPDAWKRISAALEPNAGAAEPMSE